MTINPCLRQLTPFWVRHAANFENVRYCAKLTAWARKKQIHIRATAAAARQHRRNPPGFLIISPQDDGPK
jgi:hypothetical protein